ncbi:MAG TPA: threonine synthase [Blastocatellia bacterium]|nr:threonine synthase [Blastocatellia bacterium]
MLDVVYDLSQFRGQRLREVWDARRASPHPVDQSGVWRFRELLPEAGETEIVTMIEGNTQIFEGPRSARYAGLDRLAFKHLGLNPTGSFKDLGMTTGVTQARRMGARSVACASTGNTSASMAAYAARAGMKAFVIIPSGQISLGKLSQALDYGAVALQVEGDFDVAMRLVREAAENSTLYLLNSVNPFRLEGQKTIAYELLQQRGWRLPDRVVVPGGNLGNSSAIAKGFHELCELGMIGKIPQLTIVQAEGAAPLYRLWRRAAERPEASDLKLEPVAASTLATAIKIGSPISWPRAMRGLRWSGGEVESVTEQELADAKAMIGRDGIGCEPASAVTLAGIKKMVAAGRIRPDEDVVALLTGHLLKDPDYTVHYHGGTLAYHDRNGSQVRLDSTYANAFVRVPATREAVIEALATH